MKRDHVRELAVLGAVVAALSAASAFQHLIIDQEILYPALAAGADVAPWMWGAIFVPEMLVCFAAGWRLRGPRRIVLYAIVAALHHAAWSWGLARAHAIGHPPLGALALARETAASAVLYLAVFWIASASARTPGFVPAAGE
jgi:hypothetical protein